jgi:uncharacterized protein (TIGR04255 family)
MSAADFSRGNKDVPFKPKTPDHAIVEVILGLQLARELVVSEIEGFAEAHEKFRVGLPRLARTSMFQVLIGPGPPFNIPAVAPAGGVTFDRIKPDGSLEWRLRVEGNAIFVNCLEYNSWTEVWKRAREYLEQTCELVGQENAITGVLLQYVDVFEWEGKAIEVQPSELLDKDSKFVPAYLWDKGALWHLHQGWFRALDMPIAEKMLERVHVDSVSDDKGVPTVKMDTFHEITFKNSIPCAKFFGKEFSADNIFDQLHKSNKDVIRALLTKEMAKRINLDA